MKLVVCIGTACALHVAVIATLHGGSPHAVDATGPVQAIEVDEIVAPRILTEEEPTHQEPATTQLAPRVGSPSVRVVATSPATPAASNDDVVPQPPVNTPVTPHFHMPSQLGNDGRAMATTMPVEQTFAESDVTERATFSSGARPTYPERALVLGVELDTPLVFEIVVDTRGVVVDARAENTAGYGFDEAALTALRRYRFTPAKREGETVRVRMRWTVEFHLKA